MWWCPTESWKWIWRISSSYWCVHITTGHPTQTLPSWPDLDARCLRIWPETPDEGYAGRQRYSKWSCHVFWVSNLSHKIMVNLYQIIVWPLMAVQIKGGITTLVTFRTIFYFFTMQFRLHRERRLVLPSRRMLLPSPQTLWRCPSLDFPQDPPQLLPHPPP